MRRLLSTLVGSSMALVPSLALAEGAGGSYRGIAQIYYTLITVILIYGVHDTFGKQATYIVGPLIVIGMYLLLPNA